MKIWPNVFLTFVVFHKVQTMRLVVNTTCLELAKPSNQHFRLTCTKNYYHCLLDETFTKEFEVCRQWQWIPGGNCAYFNSYGTGNIDGRNCKPKINMTCSDENGQFSSAQNTKFTACYAKRESVTSLSTTTSPIQVTFNRTSERDTASSFSFAWIIFLLYIVAGLLSFLAVLSFIRPFSRKVNSDKKSTQSSDETSDNRNAEQNLLIYGRNNKLDDRLNMMSESEDYFISVESRDDKIPQEVGEKSAGGTSNRCSDSVQLDVTTDKEEPNELFNDTVEKLKEKTNQTDEKNIKLLNELYDLLNKEGLKLSQEVMAAIISKETGKTINDELANKEVQCKVEEYLRDGLRYLANENDRENSINVSYALLRIILGEKDHPKSGWGNPIWKKDVGIGDDVERLNRIQTIARETSDPADISEEDYFRLLDIMLEALARLNHDKYRALADKMKSIKNPSLIQTLSKKTIEMYKSLTYCEK